MTDRTNPLDTLTASGRVERLLDLGSGLELWRVHIDELREQDRNAQTMDPETFNRLAENIARDRRLEALPFCAARVAGGKPRVEIVSGHHRVRAARKANLLQIHVLVDVTDLARSAVVSKQLAHNAIVGKSDEQVLAELFAEMDDLQDMIASHVDPFKLGIFEPLEAPPIEPIALDLESKTIAFAFLPSQLDDFDEVCKALPPCDELRIVPAEDLAKFEETLRRLGRTCNIKALGSIISRMCDITREWLDAQPEPEPQPAARRKPGRKGGAQKAKPAGPRKKPATSAIEAFAEAQRRAQRGDE